MSHVLCDLMTDLAASPALASFFTGKDEFWFRANDRFDVCASWVDGERCVQLMSLLRARRRFEPPGIGTDPAAGWHGAGSVEGEWTHTLAWHAPSSAVAALSRGPAHTLDGASFAAFVQGFIDRLVQLDRLFNEDEAGLGQAR